MSTTPIVALDLSNANDALALVDSLGERCRFYKIGNELFTSAGPPMVRELRARGAEVFLDLKFHDIPNTVARGVANAAALGARLVTVHAAGGMAMLRAAADAASSASSHQPCDVLGVTVLTSLTGLEIAGAWGRPEAVDVETEVLRLSALAAEAGVRGVVCGGHEASAVRTRFGEGIGILVPGVRSGGARRDDQARVVTAREAAQAGANYIVVGRMVTTAPDRAAAMDGVLAELRQRG